MSSEHRSRNIPCSFLFDTRKICWLHLIWIIDHIFNGVFMITFDHVTKIYDGVNVGLEDACIDIDKGDITFSANYPTVATAALDEFFEVGKAVTVTTGTNESYSGKSYMLTPKTTEVSMLIEDQDKKFAITFARVSITARLAYDSDTKMWYIGLNGRVLTNLADGEGDVSIAVKSA